MSILGQKALCFYQNFIGKGCLWANLWYSSTSNGDSGDHNTIKPSEYLYFKEEELNESFIKGWGPGGQKINKTSSCVMLKHLPTGMIVKCQATRTQNINRRIARQLLEEKLDVFYNGPNSKVEIEKQKYLQEKKIEHEKSKRRLEMKKAFKEQLLSKEKESSDKNDCG